MFAPHFDGKRFYNPGRQAARGLLDVLRWKLTSRAEPSPERIDDVHPVAPPHRVEAGSLRVTMVNHSTLLIQTEGTNILTDPIWSERASPFSWAGPRRKRRPGIRLDELPPIDIVLLSHNHYDHLDVPTLRVLAERGRTEFICPLKVRGVLAANGIGAVQELDWGQAASLGPITVIAVPATHFSARSLFDRNRTLWCGYAINAATGLVLFAADSAFGNHFEAIRSAVGRPRVALLPIGAYLPRWMMEPVHMGPEDAVMAAGILGADVNIAIHHGTFQLGDDAPDTPAIRLSQIEGGHAIRVLRNGESLELP